MVVQTKEYYLAIKRSRALIRAAEWVNLKNMLSDRSQTEKATEPVTPLTGNVQNRHIHRDGEQIAHYQGLGEEEQGVTAEGTGSPWGVVETSGTR